MEGSIRHPNEGEAWEYSVVVTIKNDRGEEVSHQVLGVGALQPGEERTFTFAVEVFAPDAAIVADVPDTPLSALGGVELTPSTRRVR